MRLGSPVARMGDVTNASIKFWSENLKGRDLPEELHVN
jgi:hypothetical protein